MHVKNNAHMSWYVGITPGCYGRRISGAWEVHQHPLPTPHPPSLTPYPKGLASAHACKTAWEWLLL